MADLREILFLVRELKDKNFTTRTDNDSIFNKAKVAVLQFPVVCSDSISLKELMTVNKALERNYCSYVRIAMGLNNVLAQGEDVNDFIRRFHTNAPNKSNLVKDTYDTTVNDIIEKYKEDSVISNESVLQPFSKNEIISSRLGLNNMNLNECTIERDIKNKYTNLFNEAKRNKEKEKDNKFIKFDIATELEDSDIKKANELVPSTFKISIIGQLNNGANYTREILLGVKTTSHLVKSEVMVENLTKSLNEKKGFFKFIQWTTGEIKFFKDFLLCLDDLKNETFNYKKNKKDEKIFRSLKDRATLSRLRTAIHLKDTLIPNSTLIISMDEVDYIRNMYDIDLLNSTGTVAQLMDIFFLLGFVIIDSASEVVYFNFNGMGKYQTYTLRALERENRNTENELKALVSLMGR